MRYTTKSQKGDKEKQGSRCNNWTPNAKAYIWRVWGKLYGKPFIKICWCLCERILCKNTCILFILSLLMSSVHKTRGKKYSGIVCCSYKRVYRECVCVWYVRSRKKRVTPIAFLSPFTKCLWLKLNTVVKRELEREREKDDRLREREKKRATVSYPVRRHWHVGGLLFEL